MLEQWFPITYAINSLNRSMGRLTCIRSCCLRQLSTNCGLYTR
jgi:hypothetical protein